MRRERALVAVVAGTLSLVLVCAGSAWAQIKNVNIATATTAGVYYPLGNAMAQIFAKKVPGVRFSAQATAGTPQNILLMQKKEAEIAFAQNGIVYYAYNGKEMFKDKPDKTLRAITHLYPNVMQIVTNANTGIASMRQFEGKRFVPGAVGSATEVNSREILGLYGLDYREKKNVRADYLGYAEAADALKDGRAEGILIAGGLPTAAVMDVASILRDRTRLLSIEPDMLKKLVAEMPWYYEFTIPKGTYMGQAEDVRTVAVANILIVRQDLPDDLVYTLTKTLYESLPDLVAAHRAAKDMIPEAALSGLTCPLHPGAERYYRERGILK
jgi:TRAP transporter TAXI family solute receptor